MLQGLLKRTAPDLFSGKKLNIDPGVLHAFLTASEYKHGVRSMESIIASSLLAGKTYYERSCLPSESQLSIHVNAVEFLALVQEPVLKDELLETLAAGVHRIYQGGSTSWDTEVAKQTYEQLSDDLKLENQRNVKGTL